MIKIFKVRLLKYHFRYIRNSDIHHYDTLKTTNDILVVYSIQCILYSIQGILKLLNVIYKTGSAQQCKRSKHSFFEFKIKLYI